MTAKRVLVTGAGGFIGRWSVPALLESGYEVHAVAGRSAGQRVKQLRDARLHFVDLLDRAATRALLEFVKPTHLLHFAWIATPGVYWSSPENVRWLEAGRELLSLFEEVGGSRAVMAGTCAEYDWSRAAVCLETSTPLADVDDPAITPYARSKRLLQMSVARFAQTHAVSTAWGRIFFQYGPGEHPERLVASVIRNLLSGREAPCSHGRQVRSFLHAADVGAAFAALLDSAIEGPVNIGGGQGVTIADLLGEIGVQIGRPELVRLGARAAPAAEPPVLLPDIERLQSAVGWQPRFTLREGIADTIAWWRTQPTAAAARDR